MHRPPEASVLGDKISYSDQSYRKVLAQYVSSQGLVDYRALKEAPADLAEYYRQVARHSPDSHPELFVSSGDRLAYWINAYNATVMWNVIEHYPISSVLEVGKTPIPFLPDTLGFFLAQRFTYGEQNTSLYYLENYVVRKRFKDPRIHFAINCASLGCPRLPSTPFTGRSLDEELERETRLFVNDPKYVRVDLDRTTLFEPDYMLGSGDDF